MASPQEIDMSLTLIEFIKSRGFTEEQVDFFINENIDSKAIVMMTEDELKNIIPKYGDRMAIMNYCKKINTGKKQSLIEKLRMKINEKGLNKTKEEKAVSKRRKKQTRFIEIGWVCGDKNSNNFKYVRTQKGGGTRRISIDASSKCGDILEKSLSLFFPRGESTKGKLHIFDYELLDYQRLKCDLNLTVQEMYEISALSTLRFYLSTSYKEGIVSSDGEHDEDKEIATCVTEYAPQLRRSQRLTQTRTASCSLSDLVEEATDGQKEMSEAEIVDPTERTDDNLLVFIEEGLDGIERNLEQHYTFVDLMPPQLSEFDDNPIHRFPITIHRGRVLHELIEACKLYEDISTLQITMISPNGEQEMAEDMGGVMRDTLSEFWNEFYEKCTTGTNIKIPCLREDFGVKEWEAVGRIMASGYRIHTYFPIYLAPTFLKNCINRTVDNDELIDDFLKYISEYESDLLKKALINYAEVEEDEIYEILSIYDARRKPNPSNFRDILIGIAQKELIQKPEFVAKCFTNTARLSEILEFDNIFDSMMPTARNIISHIKVRDEHTISSEANKVFGFLKRYIRDINDTKRSMFLRFCTGSDIVNKDIEVTFTDINGLGRRPIAHTCSCNLELPHTYEDYISFRNEFNGIFSCNVWTMDMV